ncbi:MAG: transcription termination factor NusA [Defluviitaleaceae bacterium]|nr:transcription termination factor NusA [Defluviitaleaceae bacterium]
MDNGSEFIDALSQIAREKGIDKKVIYEAIESSLISACKKNYGSTANIRVTINNEAGKIEVAALKQVVDEVTDPAVEMTLAEAKKLNEKYEIGDTAEIHVAPKDFGRISAQTAKQVVMQKFREAEREILYNEYITKERDIVTGIVQRHDRQNVIVGLGRLEAVLALPEQMPRETYNIHDRIKVYVLEVKQTNKGPIVHVSRTNPELVKRLFEQEVPEIFEGVVEIVSIAREPGNRSKLAVYSKNANVEPVGACVGQSGYRVNIISQELNGEKLDVIQWSSEPEKFISAALSPSKVVMVKVNHKEMTAKVVVPDHQLSLAIGNRGQNARLAAKLTGWRIDIRSETQASETGFITDEQEDETTIDKEKYEDREKVYDDDYDDDDYDEDYDDDDYDDDDYDDDDDDYDDEDDYDDDDYDDDDYDDDYDDEDEYEEEPENEVK